MQLAKGVSAPFSVSLHAPRLRSEALLQLGLAALQRGLHGDALVAAESLARQHPTRAAPAALRAKILEACGSPLALRAWQDAWAREPESTSLQDALLLASEKAYSSRRVVQLALAFFAQRHREGTHAPLLERMRLLGVPRVGLCWKEGGRIAVACFNVVAPSSPVALTLAQGTREQAFVAPGDGTPTWVDPPQAGSEPCSIAFAQALPGDIRPTLEGSPIAFGAAASQDARASSPRRRSTRSGVDIVIPVYSDRAAVQACIKSVLSSLPQNKVAASVVVVDDASPDPAISAWLDGMARAGWLTVVRNRHNLGFIGSANVGMRRGTGGDALLLNADTEVFGDWIDRLCGALDTRDDLASVMPWSNNGEIANVAPDGAALGLPDSAVARRVDQAAAQAFGAARPGLLEIPTCSGFAMLIRRDALEHVGLLDAAALSRGYLEEVDWCLRAREAGWRHGLALGVFVAHRGSSSFGAEKVLRVRQNRAVIAARYPGYHAEYNQFLRSEPLTRARRKLAAALQDAGVPWLADAPAPARSAPVSLASLPTATSRVAVWHPQPDPAADAQLLALARRLASVPGPQLRLLVFGQASEALHGTGVVDVVPLGGRRPELLDDQALMALTGCSELLVAHAERAPPGHLPVTRIDHGFDVADWLASRLELGTEACAA